MNFRSLFANNKKDKLIDREQIEMFLEYIEKTNTFVKIWTLDLDKIIRHNIVKFVENKKRENVDLKMRVRIVNILSKRQFVDKFCKNTIN